MKTTAHSTLLPYSRYAACTAGRPAAIAPIKPQGRRASRRTALQRLLFLDIDGVLHPTLNSITAQQPTLNDTLFGWLPSLTSALKPHSDVSIVVHSTWRYNYNADEWRDILGSLRPRVLGATPLGPRYESILSWLHMNPVFANYRILDDDGTEFPAPPPVELILCDPAKGVSEARVLAALSTWLKSDLK